MKETVTIGVNKTQLKPKKPHYRNFPMVSRVMFGRNSFLQLGDILHKGDNNASGNLVFFVDDVFQNNNEILSGIPRENNNQLFLISANEEPKTQQIDELVNDINEKQEKLPKAIIGIGGGSVLDITKAVSVMLTNPGSSVQYQGWDLVKNPGVYHVGIPTISGTGAEVSRTAVLSGPQRKLGINSDYIPFDQVLLDPALTKGVPREQWFYTGMDCFIHSIESLAGTYLNTFSKSYGEKALELCKEVFLNHTHDNEAQEKLMMASWHGGMSIAYSQVGIAHALSYGLSHILGVKHGIGNCLVFNKLQEYYPEGVALFKEMMDVCKITLPEKIMEHRKNDEIENMCEVAWSMEPLWENALGKDWKKKIDKDKICQILESL